MLIALLPAVRHCAYSQKRGFNAYLLIISLLTDGPVRSSIHFMRGLLRFFVVAFTVVSLLLVAAVAVSASSGKVGLFSGHSGQTAAHHENGDGGGNCRPQQKHHHTHATDDQDNDECGGGGGDDD